MSMDQAPRSCVLYARISLSKEESVSVDRQLESCRKYAEARSWQILGEFVDDGVSATANRPEDRKGWNKLLATPDFGAVVIWKVDRLARKVLDFLHVDEALRQRGAGLVAVEDPIDMTSPQGRAFAVMLAVFGEMEAEGIRARVRAARAHIVKAGRFAGGGVPYGYRSVGNPDGPGRVLAKDPERAPWLAEIVAQAQRGANVNAIARWLTAENAPLPARSAPRRDSANVTWNRQTVDGLLRNPVLAGMTPYNPGRARSGGRADPFSVVCDEAGVPVVDESLAIITVEEFRSLLQVLESRNTPQARKLGDRQRTSPLLSRAAQCDACDVYLCRGTNQKRPVLICPRCRQTIGREALDAYLARRLLRERGGEPFGSKTVRDQWRVTELDDLARREVLLSQINSLRIRRGAVGRFDKERVLLRWTTESLGVTT